MLFKSVRTAVMGGESSRHANGSAPAAGGKPRILILSASVGGGHMSAARSLHSALSRMSPEGTFIRTLDALERADPLFRFFYKTGYLTLIEKFPYLVGYAYELLDRNPGGWTRILDACRLNVQELSLNPMIQILKEEPWDAVLCTHFLPAEIVASLKAQGELSAKTYTVITDIVPHRLWIHEPCDRYFVAAEEGLDTLAAFQAPAGQAVVTGIPIHPRFSRPIPRAKCLQVLNLQNDRPIVLQMAGGAGTGPMEEVYRELLKISVPLQIVVVVGDNPRAQRALEAVPVPAKHRVRILGFVQMVRELMEVATLGVTKPGGLTISEALACELPLVVVHPVPGQEGNNSDFLLENGAAVKVGHFAHLARKVEGLLGNPERLSKMRENARRLAKPDAAQRIAREVLDRCRVAVHQGRQHGR